MARQNKVKNENDETLKAGCVVVRGKEVLLITDQAKRVWQFPKGHAEKGETLEQVALREVQEETGYLVEIVKRLSDVTYKHGQTKEAVRVAIFLAKPIEQIGKGEKKTHSEWMTLEKARKLLFPNLVFILNEVGKVS